MNRFRMYKYVVWIYLDGSLRGSADGYLAVHDRETNRYALFHPSNEALAHLSMNYLNSGVNDPSYYNWQEREEIR